MVWQDFWAWLYGCAEVVMQPCCSSQLKHKKLATIFDVRNEGGPGIVLCTQPKVVTTKFKKCVRKLAFNLYIKTFFLVYM